MITVSIIDDHKLFVEGLLQIINRSEIATVLDVSHSAAEGLNMLALRVPDVLLLDISLPDMSGRELCEKICSQYPQLKICVQSSHSEYNVIMDMIHNGAIGYVLKNTTGEELLKAIKTVATGEKFLCSEIKRNMSQNNFDVPVLLTRREKSLLQLIVAGNNTIQIADKLCLGVETIKSYRKNLLLKLGAKNTADLVRIALENSYV